MPMDSDSDGNDQQATRNPLIPIGIIVLGILVIPIFLYSSGPEGPIKKGDVVFSTGRHRVHFVEPTQYQSLGYQSFCVIEPRDQLIVTQLPTTRPDGSLLARPLARTTSQFPICPPKADLILHSHQATLQVDTWGGLKDTLSSFFSAN